jgi:hypothetical protein
LVPQFQKLCPLARACVKPESDKALYGKITPLQIEAAAAFNRLQCVVALSRPAYWLGEEYSNPHNKVYNFPTISRDLYYSGMWYKTLA